MEVAPLLSPIPLPDALQVPAPTLNVPLVEPPRWVPIPPRVKDIAEPSVPQTSQPSEPVQQEQSNPPQSVPPPPVPAPPPPPLPPLPELPEVLTEVEPEGNAIIVPIIEVELPLPTNEVMVVTATTATVAAVASVGGALVAKTFFDYLLKLIKPLLKVILNKIQKRRGKQVTTWARQRQLERRRK
jgi:hypothetical protein